jgi:hypothetical protein
MNGDADPEGWTTQTGAAGEAARVEADAGQVNAVGFLALVAKGIASLWRRTRKDDA